MTSEQVMLIAVALLLCSCVPSGNHVQQLPALPGGQHVWAVAPMRNESGSLHADGLALADQVARQLEMAPGMVVMPVNRALLAMQSLGMTSPTSRKDALSLLTTMGADALVVGTITAYDPYDPPKLGLAIELYVSPKKLGQDPVDLRKLASAAVDRGEGANRVDIRQPVCVVSAVFDAADPQIGRMLEEYASSRGDEPDDPKSVRLHRISMDLFSKFVTHVMSLRLIETESRRLDELTQIQHVPDR